MKHVDIAVIGGGPAGMTAAATAARYGVSVALIEDQAVPGGKVFQPSARHGADILFQVENRIRNRLVDQMRGQAYRIQVYPRSQVFHIENHHIIHIDSLDSASKNPSSIHAARIILAEGAMERQIPFPGWTLPGIFSAGGLGLLAKKGVVPGQRILIAGTGPLQVALTRHLIQQKAHVAGIVSPISTRKWLTHAIAGLPWMGPVRMIAALNYFREVRQHRIPVYSSHWIDSAFGDEDLNRVSIFRIDSSGRKPAGYEKIISADTLAIGFGLIASTGLSQICGCLHHYDEMAGYWKPVRDSFLETSVSGVFVIGDSAGIRGYEAAMLEGKIAAIEACTQLGKLKRARANTMIRPLRWGLISHNRMGRIIDAFSKPDPAIYTHIPDHAVICRCEDISLGEIRHAVADGAVDIHDIKRRTRLGMGRCQGRFCGQTIQGVFPYMFENKGFTPQIPVRPVSLGRLAEKPDQE
ncbi:MAG: FAD-dependent oxidoreductase [Desulfatirhabdiaceae bacterium]